MTEEKYQFQTCYLCGGARFFELSTGKHYPCPLCGMDGCILVKDGQAPPVPGSLVRSILKGIKKRPGRNR